MEFLKDWGGLILSGASVIIATISVIISTKAQKSQNKINELDAKIKEYELQKIEKENKEASSSIVKARVVKVNNNNYRLKIYNAGNTIAYNITAKIPNEYGVMLINDKMPFEELEPQNGFEEILIVYTTSTPKFKVKLIWQDKNGNQFDYEQLCSL